VTETPARSQLPAGRDDLLAEAEQVSDDCLLSVLDAPWLLSAHLRPVLRLRDAAVIASQAVLRIGYGLVAGDPDDLLAAAARRGRLQETLELTRQLALEDLPSPTPATLLLPATTDLLASRAGQLRLIREVAAAGLAPTAVVLEVEQRADLRGALHRSLAGALHVDLTVDPVCDPAWGHQLRVGADRLRHEGFRLAAGDAGTGWAALDLLSALRPDVVVLSADLVARLPAAGAASAVRALVSLAGETGARTMADGADTPERAAALYALGVDWARGPALGSALRS
jgi:EAL domain-containing protein (putative c-di-GMP-specific phosphodiesterase class I)